MILELDTPTSSGWFAGPALDETNSRDASKRREDTSTDVLAYEIVRYMPDLARLLADQGQRKLRAAA